MGHYSGLVGMGLGEVEVFVDIEAIDASVCFGSVDIIEVFGKGGGATDVAIERDGELMLMCDGEHVARDGISEGVA